MVPQTFPTTTIPSLKKPQHPPELYHPLSETTMTVGRDRERECEGEDVYLYVLTLRSLSLPWPTAILSLYVHYHVDDDTPVLAASSAGRDTSQASQQ